MKIKNLPLTEEAWSRPYLIIASGVRPSTPLKDIIAQMQKAVIEKDGLTIITMDVDASIEFISLDEEKNGN